MGRGNLLRVRYRLQFVILLLFLHMGVTSLFVLGSCSELHRAVSNEVSSRQALQTACKASQQELSTLEGAVIDICERHEDKEAQFGSSMVSRLQALSDHVDSRMRGALLFGVKKALGVVSTHYKVDLAALEDGYIIKEDLSDDQIVAAVDQADATAMPVAEKLAAFSRASSFLMMARTLVTRRRLPEK